MSHPPMREALPESLSPSGSQLPSGPQPAVISLVSSPPKRALGLFPCGPDSVAPAPISVQPTGSICVKVGLCVALGSTEEVTKFK